MKKFIFKTILFFISFFLIIIFLPIFRLNKINNYNEGIYHYQLEKKQVDSYETILLGDSSLGNAINAQLFSEVLNTKAVNLGLTGSYGYAGSYNLLKTFFSPSTTKNIILIYTLDIPLRGQSMYPYLYTINSIRDIMDLNFRYLLQLVYEYILLFDDGMRAIFINKNKNYKINNDYIEQSKSQFSYDKKKHKKQQYLNRFKLNKINNQKFYFLKKIKEFCNNAKINLVYMHGPSIDIENNEYIDTLNNIISSYSFNVVDTLIVLNETTIGDTFDHVHPSYKDKVTLQYAEILKKYIKLD